jgi:tight adherence protein B
VIIPVAVFAVVAAILLVPYWLFVIRPEDQAHSAVLKRLKGSRGHLRSRLGLAKAAQHLSAIPGLDQVLTKRRGLLVPVERLLEQADSRLTVAAFLLSCAVAAIVTFAAVWWFTRVAVLAAALAAVAAWVPFGVLAWKRSRRLLKFEEQFPEALDLLSRALKAGHALTTGLQMVADEMPAPVGPEFRMLYDQQNFGMPLPEALRSFADRVPLLDAKFFVTAVMIQRDSGGNLSEILDNLASVIRDRFKVKRQIRVISAHGRLTGFVLFMVPPSLAAVLFTLNPDHIRVLVNDPLGVRLILLAVFLQVTGGLIIRKLIRIEY